MKQNKTCPNCGDNHKNKRSDYCCKVKRLSCPNCNKVFDSKCNMRAKRFCSQKCSTQVKENECLLCGEPCKEKYCNREITITCKVCNKKHKTKCRNEKTIYCSGACAVKDPEIKKKIEATQFERYGSLAFNTEKQRKTMIERYGYSTPAKNEEVKKKSRETQLKNNGGVLAFNTPKQKETMLQKYGSEGRLGDPKELEKQQNIMLQRYGVKTPSEHPEFLKKAMNTLIERYGQIFNNSSISKVNMLFANLIEKELNVKVEFEYPIEGRFFDLYLPDYNIAIEINPTITHNSTLSFACKRNKCDIFPCKKHKPLEKSYHFNRAKLAKDNDLKLIQVYEWDNPEKLIKLLKGKVSPVERKYSARSLELREIKQREANEFLNIHHFQGQTKKQIYCYGLFKDEELLAVATFGKSRFKSKYEYEFLRYAVKMGVIIHGASGKLVKRFIEDLKPSTIISYIDFNHTTAKHTFLNSIGFKEIEETGPRLVFHNDKSSKVVPITSLLMIGADRILGTNYGSQEKSGMNNEEIMIKEGFVKVYTAGNRVFVWSKK